MSGEPLLLRDGSRVVVRPLRAEDEAAYRAGFDRLGPESRYRRFLAPVPRLTAATVRHLIDVDQHDHVALAAFDADTGAGVGVARFIREAERPDVAEAAVTVVDDWQRRGLGTALLDRLAARAHDEGVAAFSAYLLATNHEMRDLLERVGSVRTVGTAGGVVELEVSISDRGTLCALLRAGTCEEGATPVAGPRHALS